MPYLADIDAIIWLVIIVVSIIAQIIKGAKKTASQAPKQENAPRSAPAERRSTPAKDQRKSPSSYRDRKDELRQFLERIADPTPEPVPEVTVPRTRRQAGGQQGRMPPPPPTRSRQPQTQREKRPAMPSAPAAPSVTMRTPSMQATAPDQLPTTVMGTSERTSSAQGRELRKLLDKPQSQRRAILLREILGPPLALRQPFA